MKPHFLSAFSKWTLGIVIWWMSFPLVWGINDTETVGSPTFVVFKRVTHAHGLMPSVFRRDQCTGRPEQHETTVQLFHLLQSHALLGKHSERGWFPLEATA